MSLGGNPRYAAYARAHGRTPDEQLQEDRRRWPGGSMCGFTLWNREMLRRYASAEPESFYHYARLGSCDSGRPPSLLDHEAYDRWLETNAEPIAENA